jgi:uncharacterized protein (DUF2062 family)
VKKTFAKLRALVLDQLRQGITPEKIALTIALAAGIGVFPLLGTTTVLCLAVGMPLRLNQALMQLVNYLVYPLQIAGIYLFVRVGERLAGAKPMSFRVGEIISSFGADPLAFLRKFGMTGVHGIAGWAIIVAPVAFVIYVALVPVLRRATIAWRAATQ